MEVLKAFPSMLVLLRVCGFNRPIPCRAHRGCRWDWAFRGEFCFEGENLDPPATSSIPSIQWQIRTDSN